MRLFSVFIGLRPIFENERPKKTEKRLNSAQTGDVSNVAYKDISTVARVANNTNNHAPTASKEKAPTVSNPDALEVSKISATAVVIFCAQTDSQNRAPLVSKTNFGCVNF